VKGKRGKEFASKVASTCRDAYHSHKYERLLSSHIAAFSTNATSKSSSALSEAPKREVKSPTVKVKQRL